MAASLPNVALTTLECAFDAYRADISAEFTQPRSVSDFRLALAEVEDAFIVLDMVALEGDRRAPMARFHNPSVADFLEARLGSLPAEVRRLARTAVAYEQVERLAEIRGHAVRRSRGHLQ